MLLSLIVFVLLLSILVFVHELGHFLVAKWSGMRVDEFAIGFPPRLIGRKRGDTTYAINIIPLGGYVRIHGENPQQVDEDPRSFQHKSVWARIAVVVAGVTMNLLFAFIVLTIAFSVGFVSSNQDLTTVPGAVVKHTEVLAVQVLAGSPAEKAGLQPGDSIGSIGETAQSQTAVTNVSQLHDYALNAQKNTHFQQYITYLHNNSSKTVAINLAPTGPALGIGLDSYSVIRVPVWRAPGVAVKEIGGILGQTWDALKGFANKLFFHAKLDDTVSGPVGIYKATSSATQQGVMAVIFLAVVLSVNLALLNILPIPALDGGKLFFLLLEAIFRKRVVNENIENILSLLSFSLFIVLIIIITFRDITRL